VKHKGIEDPQAAMRAIEAKCDAKIRQLGNKIEYLKAQVATEQMTREELEGVLTAARKKVGYPHVSLPRLKPY
jgi:predicted RNase H-like nuclease (RuvC/YqgF family)